jgi:hypothetical protein
MTRRFLLSAAVLFTSICTANSAVSAAPIITNLGTTNRVPFEIVFETMKPDKLLNFDTQSIERRNTCAANLECSR